MHALAVTSLVYFVEKRKRNHYLAIKLTNCQVLLFRVMLKAWVTACLSAVDGQKGGADKAITVTLSHTHSGVDELLEEHDTQGQPSLYYLIIILCRSWGYRGIPYRLTSWA